MRFFERYRKLKIAILATLVVIFAALPIYVVTYNTKPAQALSCCDSSCTCFEVVFDDFMEWIQNWISINFHIWLNMFLHRLMWFDWELWQQNMLPLFMQMGVQISAVGMHQVTIIGMFMDADNQIESQRLLQELHAKANKDYHPSIGLCEFGTRVKSLASSERKGEMNALILSEKSTDRYLGGKGAGAASGQLGDVSVRLDAFRTKYCDVFDNEHGLKFLCPTLDYETSPTPAQRDYFNADIDYQRTVEDPWTIGFDLTGGGTPSDGDAAIFALRDNIYGYESFARPGYDDIKEQTAESISDLNQAYIDLRSVVAKTKVAENSFNALMALKGEGTQGSKDFLISYLEELGIPSSEVEEYVGENPSYYAQMEILTKKAYQSPLFYTNLYDKPANVKRKGVAIQAIGLIQKFDLLKSYLRTEASLSILLELSVEQLQQQVEDNIQALSGGEL